MTDTRCSAATGHDLVERLCQKYENWAPGQKGPPILLEAANEIERLEFEYERADQSAKRLGAKWKEAVEGSGGVAQAGKVPLQDIHDAVNALGGRPDQDNSYDQGIVDTVDKVLEIIEKAQSASPAASSWQPIETAPTDGTWVLLWEIHGINTKFSAADVGRYFLGEWQNGDKTRLHNASHWMPLPACPTSMVPSTHECTCDISIDGELGLDTDEHETSCPLYSPVSATDRGSK